MQKGRRARSRQAEGAQASPYRAHRSHSHQRGGWKMSRATQWDGYIVQRTPPPECPYKGAASAEVWPLTFVGNTLASELTEQVREHFYGYDDRGRYRLWI